MHAVRAPAVQCRTATRVHVQPQRGKVQAQVLEAARQLPDAHHSFCVSCCVSPPPPVALAFPLSGRDAEALGRLTEDDLRFLFA